MGNCAEVGVWNEIGVQAALAGVGLGTLEALGEENGEIVTFYI